VEDLVGDAARCVLAVHARQGPRQGPCLSPMALWSDGTALWMSAPAGSAVIEALLRRPDCVLYVPPAKVGERATVVRGRARVFGLGDPVGLVLHAPTVATAMAALAVHNAPSLAGYVQDAARVPRRLTPRNRVAVKVSVLGLRAMDPPVAGPGIAPALPTEVPPDVRRALAGERRAVLAVSDEGPDGELLVAPVIWGAGMVLSGPPVAGLPSAGGASAGAPAALAVTSDPSPRPTATVGLVLAGRLVADRFTPTCATWWHGFDMDTADVAPRPAGGIVLPD